MSCPAYTGISSPPWMGLLVHRSTHLYTLVEGRAAKVKCLTQEHNTVSTAGA